MEPTSTSPATSNAIRRAEQSGNLAKQRFARKGWLETVVELTRQMSLVSGLSREANASMW